MDVLIIGGTRFLGRFLTDAALARGHRVTHFNRGKSNQGLYPQVETLIGDRNGDLTVLQGRRWDAVLDTSGYTVPQVRRMAETLADNVSFYAFISSISVYSDFSQGTITESSPVAPLSDENAELSGENYGALKAACEALIERMMPGRVLNARAGLIVGPYDYTGRFTYWVRRVAQGGEVLAPGEPERRVQVIDGRDLAEWVLRMADQRTPGTFNATGPEYPLTMRGVLEACREGTGSDATFTWIPDEFLLAHQVEPWEMMPLWLPASTNMDAMLKVDISRALAAGLHFRPLTETVRDIRATLGTPEGAPPANRQVGLSPEKETEVLRAWQERDRAVS